MPGLAPGILLLRAWQKKLCVDRSRLGFERNTVQLHQVLGVKLHEDGSSDMPLRPDWT